MREAEIAGGTFAGGESLAVLVDVELAEVDVDLAFPAPNGHLLVLRYLHERRQNDPMELGF